MADFYLNNVTGLIDIDAFVQSLTLFKQKQLQKLSQDKALLQAKASSISNLLNAIKDLQNTNDSFIVNNLFKGKKVTSSDQTAITASVTESAPNITMKVKVLALSQGEIRVTSGGVSSLTDSLSPATFTLKYWTSDTSSQETTINFAGGTLNDLVKAINEAQDKVVASVYFDGSKYKLMLAEKDVGASSKETNTLSDAYVIEVSSGNLPTELGNLNITLQEAKNARLKIGSDTGEEVSSPTNTFKDLVSGLTLTANKTTDSFVTLTIEDSYENAKNTLTNLFNKINGVLDLVNQLTDKGALFQGNATITQIKVTFFNLTRPLQQLGLINLSKEGKYSLNTEAFNSLLQTGKLEDLKRAIGDTQKAFKTYLEGLVKTFQAYKNTQDKKIESLDERAKELQISLAREQEKLRLTFSKIEALMYQNEQLRGRLEKFVTSLSEVTKK